MFSRIKLRVLKENVLRTLDGKQNSMHACFGLWYKRLNFLFKPSDFEEQLVQLWSRFSVANRSMFNWQYHNFWWGVGCFGRVLSETTLLEHLISLCDSYSESMLCAYLMRILWQGYAGSISVLFANKVAADSLTC